MRKFRHKTSGITAILNEDGHYHFIRETKDVVCQEHIHKSFIENSNDWEEILVENTFSRNIFKPKEEPNYLITAFESNKNNAIYKINSSGKYEHQNKNSYNADRLIELGFIIISVKNHIGIEYKIGDKFKSPLSENKFKIAGFTIKNDIMYVCTECNYKFNINDLDNIILSNEVKSTIYTTTDGVDIKEGSHLVLYLVNKELNTLLQNVAVINNFSKQDAEVASRYLTFTSEENRDKYIKESRKKSELDEHNKIMKEKIDKEFNKKPIFVSADGVEYFKTGEKILLHGVWIKSDGVEPFELFDKIKHECDLDVTFSINTTNWLWFSDEKLAQEYIDNNKPKYSLADVERLVNGLIISSKSINKENVINGLKKLGK